MDAPLGEQRDQFALHDLIGQIPTPILADALGYNPNFVAERAANLSTGWNAYVAVSR